MSEILPNVDENDVERAGQGKSPPTEEAETPLAVVDHQAAPDALPVEAETPLPPVEAEPPASIVLAVPPAGEAPEGAAPLPPPSVAEPAPARKAQPALVTRGQAFWMMIGSSLLAFCLAVVFVLVLLSALNGGLRYARPAQLYAAQSRLDGLSQQAESLQASLDEIGSRLDQLESLGSRVGAVESELERLEGCGGCPPPGSAASRARSTAFRSRWTRC